MYKGAKIENENKAPGKVPNREKQAAYSAGRKAIRLHSANGGRANGGSRGWWWEVQNVRLMLRHEYTCLAQAKQVRVSCTTHKAAGMRDVLKQQWLCTQRGTLWASYKLR